MTNEAKEESASLQQTCWQQVYEHRLVPAIFTPWSHKTLELVTPQPGESVLDVACGTGVVARLAAQYIGTTGHVVGLDVNPGMIEVARMLPAPPGISIDWLTGDALTLPFPEETFHIIYCQGGLQFFPGRLTALREMRRILRPKGKIVIMVCQDIKYCPGFAVLSDLLTSLIGPEAAADIRVPFALPEATELRSLMVRAGFSHVNLYPKVQIIRFLSPEDFVECLITGSTLSARIDSDMLTVLKQAAGEKLHSFVSDGRLAFPMRANFAVAQLS